MQYIMPNDIYTYEMINRSFSEWYSRLIDFNSCYMNQYQDRKIQRKVLKSQRRKKQKSRGR